MKRCDTTDQMTIAAGGADLPTYSIQTLDVNLPLLGTKHLRFAKSIHQEGQSLTTVIIGRNGCGKSSLLRDLVMIMRSIWETGHSRAKSKVAWRMIDRLDSISNGSPAIIRPYDKSVDSTLADSPDYSTALPRRVIALSFTPYDKFPMDQVPVGSRDSFPSERQQFYVYLGFKTGNGIVSPRHRMLQVVGQLVNLGAETRAGSSIDRTLEAIGYEPRLAIEYGVPYRLRDYIRKRRRGNPDYEFRAVPARTAHQFDVLKTRFSDLQIDNILRENVAQVLDFRSGSRELSIDQNTLAHLIDAGILSVNSVKLFRKESSEIDLMELSSGELNIFSAFLGLAANLEDGCLVLIDEPENSLHPEWQIRYMEMLMAVLQQHAGCHYIIATHSPLIVSGASKFGSQILRLDDDNVEIPSEGIANQSPDATLMNAFDVVTVNNSYLRQLLLEGMTLLEQEKLGSARGAQILAFLSEKIDQVPSDDPARKLIVALLQRGLGDEG